jgi:hypothetical protein
MGVLFFTERTILNSIRNSTFIGFKMIVKQNGML